MELDADAADAVALKNDARDLFSAAVALGEDVQEFSLEHNTLVTVFKRGKQWKEALDELRRLLKKHREPPAPMRTLALSKWGLIENRLLPLVEQHGDDR